ncbi:MAG: fasciclin domain-containing protein, partial [Phycisphaerales bacterium]
KMTKPAEPATKPAELKAPPAAPTTSIFETAFADKNFSTLTQLLKEADWHNQLSEAGKFTVFAPTDEAFKKVDAKALESLRKDKKALGNVLTFHVIKGAAVSAADAMKMTESVPTVQGSKFNIQVKDGKVMVGNSKGMATVIKANIECTNGVIHVIDGVLMPEDAAAKPADKKAEAPAKKEEGKGGAPANAPAKDPK